MLAPVDKSFRGTGHCVLTLFEVLGCVVEENEVALDAVGGLVHHLDFERGELIRLLLEHL